MSRIFRLFDEMVHLTHAQRINRLEELRRESAPEAAEIASLLDAHFRANDLLRPLESPDLRRPGDEETDRVIGGRFKVIKVIGFGGMGTVYQCRDERLGRVVAVKVISSALGGDTTAVARFVREARAASVFDHSNIVTVHDIGVSASGRAYIVMAYYEGEDLKSRLRGGPVPLSNAVHYMTGVLSALEATHSRGIVHRDVKPSNLFITADDQLKVLDFGLAKALGHDLTATGIRLGTVAYMSPEQIHGDGVDHRTDIWSAGVVLFEMLTGHSPFEQADMHSTMYQIAHFDPATVDLSRYSLPSGIAPVLARCLSRDAAERYPGAAEMKRDVERLVSE